MAGELPDAARGEGARMSEHTHHMFYEVERLQREGRQETQIRAYIGKAHGARHRRHTNIKTLIGSLIGR
jgi:hypothetical protein